RFSEICTPYLEQGFRIIGLDLPGFGRSSGLHAHINDCNDLIEAVHEVINHVKNLNDKKRKVILYGGSMGGMIVLSYAIKYPDNFDAFSVYCPFIYLSSASRPSKFIEILARILIKTPLGRIPIAVAHSGKSNPLNYRGNLRCSTGLAIKVHAEWLRLNLENISKPFLVQHGLCDRVTRFEGSKELFDKAQTLENQKQILLYEDCEQDMFRDKGSKEKVVEDVINWLISMDMKL
ncbi:4534_t:CDS:2, partial [Dentiscutata erythropus]